MSFDDCNVCACCVDESNEEPTVTLGSSVIETQNVTPGMRACYPRCSACCHEFEHRNCRFPHHCRGSGGDSSIHIHQHGDEPPKYRHITHAAAGVAPITSIQLDSLQNDCVTVNSADAAITTDASTTELPKLSLIDRLLTPLIISAMALGMIIGAVSSSSADNIDSWSSGTTNYPIAAGLIVMIYPPLARVRYDRIGRTISDNLMSHRHSDLQQQDHPDRHHFKYMMLLSLLLNWIIGPLLMFFLAVGCLPDKPHFIQGLILVGLARCIAMVMVWNNLAAGSEEYCVLLVLLNSAFQLIVYAPYAYFFISVFLPGLQLPSMNGDSTTNGVDQVSFILILQSVGIYLGIPFAAGFLSWLLIPLFTGRAWYNRVWIPCTSPLTLIALLFTIIVMFALKGHAIASSIVDIIRICVPLCIYFGIMFIMTLYVCFRVGFSYPDSVTLAFTAASNNFELAIAVAVASFGINADESLAAVVGPLVEVPVMLAFVHLARYSRKWYSSDRWHSTLDEITKEKEVAAELSAVKYPSHPSSNAITTF